MPSGEPKKNGSIMPMVAPQLPGAEHDDGDARSARPAPSVRRRAARLARAAAIVVRRCAASAQRCRSGRLQASCGTSASCSRRRCGNRRARPPRAAPPRSAGRARGSAASKRISCTAPRGRGRSTSNTALTVPGPAVITTTLSASAIASSRSCVTNITDGRVFSHSVSSSLDMIARSARRARRTARPSAGSTAR